MSGPFGKLLCPHENGRPYSLRTGIATPQSTNQRGHGEQREGRDDEQPAQQPEVLREKGDFENIKLTVRKIEQYCLSPVPVDPGQQEISGQQWPAGKKSQALKETANEAGEDLFPALVEILGPEPFQANRFFGDMTVAVHVDPLLSAQRPDVTCENARFFFSENVGEGGHVAVASVPDVEGDLIGAAAVEPDVVVQIW